MATPASFDIGRVIQRMFGVIGRNFGPFLLASAVFVGLPMLAIGFFQYSMFSQLQSRTSDPSQVLWSLLAAPVTIVATSLLQGSIIHGTVSDLSGRRAAFTDSLAVAIRLILPLIAIGILVAIATAIGFLLLIIPGVLVALAFCVAAPAEVIERVGIFASLNRSRDLTRGNRGAIFGLMVLYFIAAFMVQLVVGAVAGIAGVSGLSNFMLVTYVIVTPLVQVLNAVISAAGVASIYFELRNIKEGVGAETLASVFD